MKRRVSDIAVMILSFLVLLALSYFGVMSGMMSDAIIGVFSLLYNLFY